jgi:hypothetical protein
MAPKRKTKGRGRSVIEPQDKSKEKEKEDSKDAKDGKDHKDTKDNDIVPKTKEKEHTDYKIVDGKSLKEKEIKDFIEHKPIKEKEGKDVKEDDKWIGEGIPVGLGGPVEGGITIAQLARRVANLEAIVARGEAFIQPKERPAVGVRAKKRGR